MPRITKRFVDGLTPGPKEFEHWDDQLPGFGIRIKPTGVKTYVIRYRTPSGQRRLKLGRHGKLTPEQARNLAKARFAEIEAGGDPSAVRQDNRVAPTLRELAERYLKDYVEIHYKAGTARETRRLIELLVELAILPQARPIYRPPGPDWRKTAFRWKESKTGGIASTPPQRGPLGAGG